MAEPLALDVTLQTLAESSRRVQPLPERLARQLRELVEEVRAEQGAAPTASSGASRSTKKRSGAGGSSATSPPPAPAPPLQTMQLPCSPGALLPAGAASGGHGPGLGWNIRNLSTSPTANPRRQSFASPGPDIARTPEAPSISQAALQALEKLVEGMVVEQETCRARLDSLEQDAARRKVQASTVQTLQQQQEECIRTIQEMQKQHQKLLVNLQALPAVALQPPPSAGALGSCNGSCLGGQATVLVASEASGMVSRRHSGHEPPAGPQMEVQIRDLVSELRSIRQREQASRLADSDEGLDHVESATLVRELREERGQVVEMLDSIQERKLETVKLMHEFFVMKDGAMKDIQTMVSDARQEIRSSIEGALRPPVERMDSSSLAERASRWATEVSDQALTSNRQRAASSSAVLDPQAAMLPARSTACTSLSALAGQLASQQLLQAPGGAIAAAPQPTLPPTSGMLTQALLAPMPGQECVSDSFHLSAPSPRVQQPALPSPPPQHTGMLQRPPQHVASRGASGSGAYGSLEMPMRASQAALIAPLPLSTLPAAQAQAGGSSVAANAATQPSWSQSGLCSPSRGTRSASVLNGGSVSTAPPPAVTARVAASGKRVGSPVKPAPSASAPAGPAAWMQVSPMPGFTPGR